MSLWVLDEEIFFSEGSAGEFRFTSALGALLGVSFGTTWHGSQKFPSRSAPLQQKSTKKKTDTLWCFVLWYILNAFHLLDEAR